MSTATIRPNATADATVNFSAFGALSLHEAVWEETKDDDVSYAYCSGATNTLRLDLQNTGIPDDAVFASLSLYAYLRREAGVVGTTDLTLSVVLNGTAYPVAVTDAPLTTYSLLGDTLALNPATGLAWTGPEIQAAQWQLLAVLGVPRATIRVTQAYAVVDYYGPTFTQRLAPVS